MPQVKKHCSNGTRLCIKWTLTMVLHFVTLNIDRTPLISGSIYQWAGVNILGRVDQTCQKLKYVFSLSCLFALASTKITVKKSNRFAFWDQKYHFSLSNFCQIRSTLNSRGYMMRGAIDGFILKMHFMASMRCFRSFDQPKVKCRWNLYMVSNGRSCDIISYWGVHEIFNPTIFVKMSVF